MKYIDALRENTHISEVYLCQQKATYLTKSGKEYESLQLRDKTGVVDAKIWEPGNPGIGDFDELDYVAIDADVILYNNKLQLKISRIRRANEGEYNPGDYMPVSNRDNNEMYAELLGQIQSVQDSYLQTLLRAFFVDDAAFVKRFRLSSAAKSVHHGFIGGLMEHTLSVARLCDYYCKNYPILNRDLLITAALCHDIGKTRELSAFPENAYTDEGQLLGHIVIGCEMLAAAIAKIPNFPEKRAAELRHCIVAHHGELEFGSPKKPALIEAMALNLADNTDAKMETFMELLNAAGQITAGSGLIASWTATSERPPRAAYKRGRMRREERKRRPHA